MVDPINEIAPQKASESFFDFYKSLDSSRRDHDEALVNLAVNEGVIPASMRYGIMSSIDRGVVKSTKGDFYYFQRSSANSDNEIYRIVKADTPTKKWEAERLYKNCKLGCDLVHKAIAAPKEDSELDKDKEDEEKAAGAPSQSSSMPPAAVPEAQDIAGQQRQMTDRHPGAAGGVTPDTPEVGRDWHAAEKAFPEVSQQAQIENPMWKTSDLLRAWGQQLQATAPRPHKVPDQERLFMIEVLGRTPEEIDSGSAVLSPTQRAQLNLWLTRSLRSRVGGLQQWLEKSSK